MKAKWEKEFEDKFPELTQIHDNGAKEIRTCEVEAFIRRVVKEERKECLSGNWVARKVKDQCATELEETIGAYRGVGGLLDKLINKWRGKK